MRSESTAQDNQNSSGHSQIHSQISQIRFIDSQTSAPREDITIGRILLSSEALDWDGFYLETGENESFNPDGVAIDQHYFAMNIGPAYEWEWKDGRRFKSHQYETGDIWINPAGTPFSHRVNTYNRFALLAIDPAKLIEILPDFPLVAHQTFRREHQSQDPQMQTLMRSLLIEVQAGGPNGKLYADLLSTALAVHFVNHYSIERSFDIQDYFQQLKSTDRQRLGQVLDYIEAHLTENISLNDLALIAGLSKFHFSRLFKSALGLTPYHYLMSRRVAQAAHALTKKATPIAQVSAEFGFTDQAHFTRNFKKIKGMTPKQFIKGK